MTRPHITHIRRIGLWEDLGEMVDLRVRKMPVDLWAAARAKSVLVNIPLNRVVRRLLWLWVNGEVVVGREGRQSAVPQIRRTENVE